MRELVTQSFGSYSKGCSSRILDGTETVSSKVPGEEGTPRFWVITVMPPGLMDAEDTEPRTWYSVPKMFSHEEMNSQIQNMGHLTGQLT